MEKAKQVNVRRQADLEPTDDPAKLKRWWFRRTNRYNAYKVKWEDRRRSGEQDYLFFRLARNEALGPFKVDLAQAGNLVWAELPSTAQHADKDRPYGFLFLSDEWAETNLPKDDIPTLKEGGKWPTSGEFTPLDQVLELVARDPDMKARLASFLDTLATSIR